MSDGILKKFAIGVLALLVLSYLLGIRLGGFYLLFPILLVLAMVFFGVEYFRHRGKSRNPFRIITGRSEFLCDDCKWNYGNVCTRAERPNATECPDYKPK